LDFPEPAIKKTDATFPGNVIEPPKGLAPLALGELWIFRELLFFLTWHDIKVRYKQTTQAATWAI